MSKRVLLALSLLVLALFAPATVAAGRVTSLTLVSESWTTYAPTNCYHEDSVHERAWEGSLPAGQSLTVTLPFCAYDEASGGVGPGGDAFLAAVSGRGALALTLISPSGVTYQAHSWSSTGGNTLSWRRCIMPPEVTAYDTIIGTIEPGVWTVVVRNTGDRSATNVTVDVRVMMAYGWWQRQNCPAADWSAGV